MFETSALQIPVIGVSAEWFIVLLLAAFAGGMSGVAFGALPSFIFTDFVVLFGGTVGITVRQFEGADLVTAGELGTGITGSIGFGPFVGPYIASASGVTASAYVGKRYADMDPSKGGYYFDKDITYAFGTQPDILAVGGFLGTLRFLIFRIAGGIGLSPDSVALSVMTTAFIARIILGYPLISLSAGSGLLNMSSFEKGMICGDGSGRSMTEPWLPHQYKWVNIVVIGFGASILGGWMWLITESFFLACGISAASLLSLSLGVKKIPVIHHITLGGSVLGAVATPMVGGSEPLTIVTAVAGGLTDMLPGEVTQRVVYVHSGTHVDPPTMPITIYSLFIGVLLLFGVIPNSAYLEL